MRSSSGFSLVEILVVLALISIAAGLASVRFGEQLHHHRLNHAVRAIVSDLRWARQLAITEGQPVSVLLNPDEERSQIERASLPGVAVKGIRHFNDRRQGFGEVDLVGSTGGLKITFQPTGITTNWTTITLRNLPGEEKRITVVLTGRVKVL